MNEERIHQLFAQLQSLTFGEDAVEGLIACGASAVPHLADFLLHGQARTISLPRCRAVRALGGLGAWRTFVAYLQEYPAPDDPQVLFAEDAVRSAVGRELLQWKTEDVFQALWTAAQQRPTPGLLQALGEFCRSESVPLLVDILEDDLCREEAKGALRNTPDATRTYALRFLSKGPAIAQAGLPGRRRLEALLKLLVECGITSKQWDQLAWFLKSGVPSFVIPAAQLARCSDDQHTAQAAVEALLGLQEDINWLQEAEIIEILERVQDLTQATAKAIAAKRSAMCSDPKWLSPSWRILTHFLDGSSRDNRPPTPTHTLHRIV